MCSKTTIMQSTSACWDNIGRLKQELDTADGIVIGAGAGLSTSAGFTYTGERFHRYFHDFIDMYGLCKSETGIGDSKVAFSLGKEICGSWE